LDGFEKIKYKMKKVVVWTLMGDEELYVPDDVLEEASDQTKITLLERIGKMMRE
jgi:hypothetical protein